MHSYETAAGVGPDPDGAKMLWPPRMVVVQRIFSGLLRGGGEPAAFQEYNWPIRPLLCRILLPVSFILLPFLLLLTNS